MSSQAEAKLKITELVEKYEALAPAQIKKYTEAETCKDFILPLFKALGWDTENKTEVSAEEHTSKIDRSDYGFYSNGWPKFYLEAKKISANIDDEKFAKQATSYSWNKGITWAILTDFESLLVFNSQDIAEHLSHKLFFRINFNEYIEKFDKLWWLSKEAFGQNILDKEAEEVGKKLQKISVTEKLYKDLNECRELLLRSFHVWNKDKPYALLDEGVQKFLDRLIFIRVAEDRELEQLTLVPMLRAAGGSSSEEFFKQLVTKFRELDKIYNSNLFTPHPFEGWQEFDGATEKVIDILHGKTGYYDYNFKAIPADILGSVYENYLGYKLSQSEKGVEVSKDARKRKEQGIYYTPTYIVDYIVTNTLKPVLDKCETVADLKAVKVLDPACGSGSFLIRAIEMIYSKYLEFGAKPGEMTKITILLDNIYGVDLDDQAVEIARLNLLLTILDSRGLLPDLSKNIKNGNSLISDTDSKLEKAFGKDYRDKKPFNWQAEFPEVFDRSNPGFDIVIGNPPYIDSEMMTRTMPEDRNYISTKYKVAKGNWDIFCVFIEQALNLCREDGYQSFIIPNKLVSANYALPVRKLLAEENSLTALRDYSKIKVFNISAYPVVYAVQKHKPTGSFLLEFAEPNEIGYQLVSQKVVAENFSKDGEWQLQSDASNNDLVKKLSSSKTTLVDIATVKGAASVSEAYIMKDKLEDDGKGYRVVNSGTIDRYSSLWGHKPMRFLGRNLLKPTISEEQLRSISVNRLQQTLQPKIVMAGMTKRPECILDKSGEIAAAKSTTVISSEKSLRLLLAILNSNLMNYYLRNKFSGNTLQGGYLRLGPPEIKQIPIPAIVGSETEIELERLVDKIEPLCGSLRKTSEGSNEWISIKSEIEKIDQQIDQLVYKLYNLTTEEIKIIENSPK